MKYNKRTEKIGNILGIILFCYVIVLFLVLQIIQSKYNISDEVLMEQYIHLLLFMFFGVPTIITVIVFFSVALFLNRKNIKHTQITGRSLEVFRYVDNYELEKYINTLQYTGRSIDKTEQTWGHTFDITYYKNIGKYNLYVGSGWSNPINVGDVVYFRGSKYVTLASVHSTVYSITQIYKVLLVDIEK